MPRILNPFDIDLDLGRQPFDSDDSDYSEDDDEVKSYYIANVAKAKKARLERKSLREENRKLKVENEKLVNQNEELMDTLKMAEAMGCFANLGNK